ncbi:hypothetical protein I907_gp61 [Bacillus phage Eoghan]|uniref:Uncharacterized protein n=2 Tax=Andromedavirus TaxID=1623275 RepID=M1IE92_9CAUD|nr:hypothetical protein I907_gp61 [Bacillus phage Eoghan]YP_009592294.1 hypothetical protein FDG68_gp61 [Bacillus phage Taylor]AGE60825.1 hypothetical protein EOGHAN_62 [Bacillus phage Eoghan]AGE60979.1 hypothetical protein TAYLOR_61 [Bacillus phage Taylor]
MIKITRSQEKAFDILLQGVSDLKITLKNVIRYHGCWESTYKSLNDLPFEDLITLIVTKEYEVVRTIEDVIDDHLGEASRKYRDNAERAIYDLKLELKQEGLI